jgi:flagellar biosynthesis/type III secretory pathway M-ring protein FliF/YscJ
MLALIAGLVLMRRKGKTAKRRVEATAAAAIAAASAKALPSAQDLERQIEGRLAEQAAANAREGAEALMSLKVPAARTKKTEILSKHIAAEAKADPNATAQLIRTWLSG